MKKLYIATAVFAFLLALLLQFPARLAWQWLGSSAMENQIVLVAPEGTVFEGSASVLAVQSVAIDRPQWQAHLLPLLTARLRYGITGSLDQYPLQTELTLAPTGSITLAETQTALPLTRVAPLLQLPVMPLSGMLALDIKKIKVKAERILLADGQAEIRNAEWLLVRPPIALGNLKANVSTEDEVIKAQLESTGPLQIEGEASLQPDGGYAADLRLRARPEAEQRLRNLLKMLGQPVDGWYRIKTQGTLPTRS